MTIELADLALLMRRTECAIMRRLYKLRDIGEDVNEGRLRYLQRDFIEQKPSSPLVITERETEMLRKNYQTKDAYELGELTGYGPYGAVNKLKALAKEQPEYWDIKRINALYAKLHKVWASQHPKKERVEERIRRKFIRGEREWSERDLVALANSYFTKPYLKLSYIFRLKGTDVLEKLDQLYTEDPDSWDMGRVAELERGASNIDLEALKKHDDYCRISSVRPEFMKSGDEIYRLILEDLNTYEIAELLGKKHQTVSQFLESRGLHFWYKRVQKAKRM